MNGWWGRYPYGDYCPMQGWYGAKKPGKDGKRSKKILQEYFKNEPRCNRKYQRKKVVFEAEIKDKNNKLLDVVIVDKRTGRIRSI